MENQFSPGNEDLIKDDVLDLTENENQDNEPQAITIELNPVQFMALRESLLSLDVLEKINEAVRKVNLGDDSFNWFNDLYSGAYAGTLKEFLPEVNDIEAIKTNMGALLINTFMGFILTNGNIEIITPVDKKVIKAFIADSK